VGCDAEKFSGDADPFAEEAQDRKMRRTSRVGGGKIDQCIVKVAFNAETCAPRQIQARRTPQNRKTG